MENKELSIHCQKGDKEKIETYINFRNLSGEELNEDFRKFCSEKGFDMNAGCSVILVPCITGHDSYIVSQEVVAKC